MAKPSTRQELIEYSLRRLGDPVIEINVDEDQLDDRVDEALQHFKEYHSDAVYRGYQSILLTQDDIDNGYVTISSNVHQIVKMFAMKNSMGQGMFSIKYQIMLNDIQNMSSFVGSLAYFTQTQQYLSMMDDLINGTPQVTYVKKQNRLYFHGATVDGDLKAGDYMVVEMYNIIDPDSFASVWDDMWLKEYTTALIKQQWGSNLIKFEGMQLPGGVTLNGRQIFEDANAEIERLREKIRMDHELPTDFFIG